MSLRERKRHVQGKSVAPKSASRGGRREGGRKNYYGNEMDGDGEVGRDVGGWWWRFEPERVAGQKLLARKGCEERGEERRLNTRPSGNDKGGAVK